MFDKLRHELNYLKPIDVFQGFLFLLAIIPGFLLKLLFFLSKKKVWIVCEDKMEARDNGYCFYKYLNTIKSDILVYYAISKKSKDFEKVKKIGKYLSYGSFKHWILYIACELNISSQKAGKPNAAVGYVLDMLGLSGNKFVFLQHGITLNDAKWLYYKNTKMRLFICGAKPEFEFVKEKFGYPAENLAYLGFTRFDDYIPNNPDPRKLLLIPSWREWIGSKNEYTKIYNEGNSFEDTQYFQKFNSLINNQDLLDYLSKNDLELIFYPHRNMQKFIKSFHCSSNNIVIADNKTYDIRKLLLECSLMITDYSSVALDFAYMNKPVIFYQFDSERFFEAQYQKGYFSYENSGLGIVTKEESNVVELIKKTVNASYETTNEEKVNNFFALHDNKNCERTYKYLRDLKK